MKIGKMLYTLREMVDSFVAEHNLAWDRYREKVEKEKGYSKGVNLSMQSYLGSDLLIDFAYLALEYDKGIPFEREYWIRSQGVQCIKNPKDESEKQMHRVFGDIVAKIKVVFDGNEFADPMWIQDDDCLIENKFIKENKLYQRYF